MFVTQPQHDAAENGAIGRRGTAPERPDCIEAEMRSFAIEQIGYLGDNTI
ncbi:hypothetical protein [Mesorhizobium sp. M1405]